MANNFTSDSNLKAHWRFESGALTVDSKGGNTLTPSASAPTEDTSVYAEGSCAVNFASASTQYYSIADASLDAGFPLKSGDTTKKISVCYWVRRTSKPAGNTAVFSKYDSTVGKRGLLLGFRATSDEAYLLWGYNNGASIYQWYPVAGGDVDVWYHFGWSIDGVAKRASLRVYNGSTGAVSAFRTTFASELYVPDVALLISAVNAASPSGYINGRADEILVFNRVLSFSDIDVIRNQTYPLDAAPSRQNDFTRDSDCKALWKLEPDALDVDSQGGNTLTLSTFAPLSSCGSVKEGSGNVDVYFAGNGVTPYEYLKINDADLDAGFPLKTGDSSKKISICLWAKPRSAGNEVRALICKANYISTDQNSFCLRHYNGVLNISWHYGAYVNIEYFDTGITLANSEWHHIGLVLDGAAKTISLRVFHASDESVETYSTTPANAMNVGNVAFSIGAWADVGGVYLFDGQLDEIVVFNRLLNAQEIDLIRDGLYGTINVAGQLSFLGQSLRLASISQNRSGALAYTGSAYGKIIKYYTDIRDGILSFLEGIISYSKRKASSPVNDVFLSGILLFRLLAVRTRSGVMGLAGALSAHTGEGGPDEGYLSFSGLLTFLVSGFSWIYKTAQGQVEFIGAAVRVEIERFYTISKGVALSFTGIISYLVSAKRLTGNLSFTKQLIISFLPPIIGIQYFRELGGKHKSLNLLRMVGAVYGFISTAIKIGTLTITGTIIHYFEGWRTLTGIVDFVGDVVGRFEGAPLLLERILSGTLSFAGTLLKEILPINPLQGVLSFVGEHIGILMRGWDIDTPSGTFGFNGTVTADLLLEDLYYGPPNP